MAFAIKHIRELLEIFKELDCLVLKTAAKLQGKYPQASKYKSNLRIIIWDGK